MIELISTKCGAQAKASDEELDWLAETYLKLQKNKTYQMMSKTFQQFITDYFDAQLREYMRQKEKNNENKKRHV
ncbi:hypothetical protein FJZ33_00025 [Candidatus Poribacteria bacterium]|nr:hypothetical protein [Candidatus Poribacteria bacterium]